MLTDQQVRHFHEEGYLFLPETFTAEECALLRDEAVEIYRHDRPEVWREKSGAPRTAFAAHLYNEAFGLLARHPRMIHPIEQIFGEQLYMHQFKINAKASFTDLLQKPVRADVRAQNFDDRRIIVGDLDIVGERVEKAFDLRVLVDQRFHLATQFSIIPTCFVQKALALVWR